MFVDDVYGLDVCPDGSVVVSSSGKVVIAHNAATGAELWRKEMSGWSAALCIHGGVVVVTVSNSSTVVLDVTTGQQLYTLPSAGEGTFGICVLDGLTLKWRSLFVSHILF